MVSMETKSALMADITELLSVVGDKFETDEQGDAERDFIVERCPPRLEAVIRSLPTLSMHLLAHLSEGPVSVVKLAARADQLKGTVSKHVQRLVEAGLVARTPVPGNRKELQLTLTEDGDLVVDAHQSLHDEMTKGLRGFLQRYSNAELETVVKVLRDLATATKVGVRLVPHT
jgi:DNA-binding MarR family transcriptional regulator